MLVSKCCGLRKWAIGMIHLRKRKVQLGFNMGAMALGLSLTKQEGFQALSDARSGLVSMQEFREHLKSLIISHKVEVDEAKIAKSF